MTAAETDVAYPESAASFVAGGFREEAGGPKSVRRSPWLPGAECRFASCGPEEVELARRYAVEAARAVARLRPFERAEILERCAEAVLQAAEPLARLEAVELGKPLKDTRGELARVAETFSIAAHAARELGGEVWPAEGWRRGRGAAAFSIQVPVGVVVAITPFNAPLNLLAHKLAASFAAGNTTVVKPAPQAPASAAKLVLVLLEAGFPPEGVQLLQGGAELGASLVAMPEARAVAFTGSAAAGRAVAHAAGPKRLVLELGGNAATIVCADADVAEAARVTAATGYSNSGQSCISVQRVYVERPAYGAFLEAFEAEVRGLKVGHPLDPATDVGTMVDETAAARVEAWIGEAVAAGGRLVAGGRREGARLWPTLLAEPPADARAVREEVFGDLVSVMPFDRFEEALAQANATPYGLQAGLFTRDLERVFRAVRELEVGGVVVNGSSNFRLDHVPFGGVKASGLGRETPRLLVKEFSETKTVLFRGLSFWA